MKRGKWTGPAGIAVVAVLTVLISLAYFRFATQQVRQESMSHLDEIYTQINSAFRSTVSKNWRLLHSWCGYVSDKADAAPEELAAFIAEGKQDWHFTSFYFLSEDGNYMTALGDRGYLDLGESLDRLVEDREDIVVDATLPSDKQIAVFAVPIQPGEYHGFHYTAIGISYNSEDMTASLSIDAFDGQSDCFITYPDGRIIFSSQNQESQPYNLLAYIRERGTPAGGVDFDVVAQDWKGGMSRSVVWKLEGADYYLCYQPVHFSSWMLVSLAPVQVVNASMNSFIVVTLIVMGLLFGIIGIGVVSFVAAGNRHRIQEKNREIDSRERLFDLLTENTEDIFVLFTPKSFAAGYVSPNAERVLGIHPEEIRGDVRPLLFGTGGEAENCLTPELLEGITMGGLWVGEREILHAQTREPRWFKLLVHRCSLEGEEQFILMLSDRTQERKMNGALQEALHTAKAANEAKSNFLANMSHDIRTPMNAIVGFSILLDKNAEDPERVREYTRKISSSSQHLLSLINDILDMSKIESGKTSLNISEFSLPEMLDELYTMMLPQARARGQSFELYTKGALPDELLGDKLRLNQVLINLLSNAVKYTQAGGHITLTVQGLERNAEDRAHLRFVVADDGFGMSKAFARTIFDPFSREVTEHTKEIQGTGLGMAITKNIVALMGGTISVASELDKGSTFTIEIELTAVSREQDNDFWQRHGITRLLVVDDEKDICLEVRSAMEGTGVEVSYATGGAQSVELAAQASEEGRAYPIILMDWKMSGMDGLEAASRIRRGAERPLILVLTSYDLEEARDAAGDNDYIDAFLAKPFFLSSFQRTVSQLVDRAGAARASQEDISLEGLKVLAAEDNEINAEILLELLDMEGVQCEIVSNGQKAVERFARAVPGEFDMIFMDVQMPVMDGYEATRAIRAGDHPEAKTIPIIAMTANAFEEDIQTALAAGMSAHTAKPIDMNRLKITVSKLWKKDRGK